MPGLLPTPVYANEGSVLTALSTIERARLTTGKQGLDRIVGLGGFQHLYRPTAVGASGGTVYVADAGNHTIYRYDSGMQTLTSLNNVSQRVNSDVAGITVDKDLSIFVAEPTARQVWHFSYDERPLQRYQEPNNLGQPVAVALDSLHNQVLVADGLFDRILVFNALGWPLFAIGDRGSGPGRFHNIVDMAQGPDGLYVLDRSNPQVQVLALDGRFLRAFPRTEVTNPSAIAVDRYGRVYVSDAFDDTIKIYAGGRLIQTFGGSGGGLGNFRQVTDLCVDGNNLYVADSLNARVQVLLIAPQTPPGTGR